MPLSNKANETVFLERLGDAQSACLWAFIDDFQAQYSSVLMTLREEFFTSTPEKAGVCALQRCLKKHGTIAPELLPEFGVTPREEDVAKPGEHFNRDPEPFSRAVIQKYQDRLIREALDEAYKAVGQGDALEILIRTQEQLRDIGEMGNGKRIGPNMAQAVKEHIEALDREAKGENSVEFPWPKLNWALGGGIRDGALYVMGARPGVGKTTFAIQSALWCAGKHKMNVVYASYEVLKRDVIRFAASCYSKHNVADCHEDYLRAACTMQEFPMTILDTEDHPFRTADQLYEDCKTLRRRGQCDILFLDHMHIVPGRERDEYKRLQHNARVFLNIALEMNIPVVLLCQLNRDIERRDNKTPTMADLRGCGDIEQNAAVVMFLDNKYGDRDHAQIVVRKNRWGANGRIVPLVHRGEHYRFEERMEFE